MILLYYSWFYYMSLTMVLIFEQVWLHYLPPLRAIISICIVFWLSFPSILLKWSTWKCNRLFSYLRSSISLRISAHLVLSLNGVVTHCSLSHSFFSCSSMSCYNDLILASSYVMYVAFFNAIFSNAALVMSLVSVFSSLPNVTAFSVWIYRYSSLTSISYASRSSRSFW